MQSVYWEYIKNQNLEITWNNYRSSFQFVREVAMKICIMYIVMMMSNQSSLSQHMIIQT